jgi:hypothetical protein
MVAKELLIDIISAGNLAGAVQQIFNGVKSIDKAKKKYGKSALEY